MTEIEREKLPQLGWLKRWWFKRREWARDWNSDNLVNVGGWGINSEGKWHIGGEEGALPKLPRGPMSEWPRRFRLAVDRFARLGHL